MTTQCPVQFDHPYNEQLVNLLREWNTEYKSARESMSPSEADTWKLHTHPDLIDYFWNFGKNGQSWAIHSAPVLAHPATGIIYAVARGTGLIVLRLPEKERATAFAIEKYGRALGTHQSENFGDEWAFVPPFDKNTPAFFEAAYQYAAVT